jgi:predicted branched-subunit amino acid permease
MAPFVVGLAPLALSIGVAVAASPIDDLAGLASGPLLFAGSAQLSAIELIGSGAGALVVLGTVLVLSARYAVYGATLAAGFRDQPRWFRILAPYFVVEPVVAVVADEITGPAPAAHRRAHYLGAAGALWVGWVGTIGLGVAAGPLIDPAWPLDFAAPLCIVAMLARRVSTGVDRLSAAVAAGTVVVVTSAGGGSATGSILGITAAVAAIGIATRATSS